MVFRLLLLLVVILLGKGTVPGYHGDKILGIIAKIWVIPVIKLDIANPSQGKP